MFWGTKKLIGVDLGTSTIKVCEMDFSGRGASLHSFSVTPTPTGSINSGEISNTNLLSSTVKIIFDSIKSKRKFAASGLSGTPVVVRRITVPRMDPKILTEQLKWEAEQYIPFDIKDISLTHHVLAGGRSSDTMDVLLVAAQNHLVEQHIMILNEAGLKVGALDVNGFALSNCFEMNYGKLMGETIGLLNIGASHINMAIVSHGEVIFCRDIPIGGANYSTEIQKEMGITFMEAESLKLSAVSKGEVPVEVHTIMNNTNESIADEIRSSFDFFNSSSQVQINRCFATGGAAITPGLLQSISQSIQIQVQLFDPFYKVKLVGRTLSNRYIDSVRHLGAIALGLGLREVSDT